MGNQQMFCTQQDWNHYFLIMSVFFSIDQSIHCCSTNCNTDHMWGGLVGQVGSPVAPAVVTVWTRLAPLAVWTKEAIQQGCCVFGQTDRGWLRATALIYCLYISPLAPHQCENDQSSGLTCKHGFTVASHKPPSVAFAPVCWCLCITRQRLRVC